MGYNGDAEYRLTARGPLPGPPLLPDGGRARERENKNHALGAHKHERIRESRKQSTGFNVIKSANWNQSRRVATVP
jgi:hypothetical protein